MTHCEPTERKWIVLLEAADEVGGATMDPRCFSRLAASWATAGATTFYSTSRYALQVSVSAANPPAALGSAMRLWTDALRRTGIPKWQLVRAEIVTPEELEHELQAAERVSNEEGNSRAGKHHEDVVSDEILRRAFHDPLTGLPDRALFLDRIRGAVGAGSVGSPVQVVMVVGLDAAGSVGSPLESAAADDVLVEMASRLEAAARHGDTVARVGPAQLGLLFEVSSGGDADRVAERIVGVVERPLHHHGQPAELTARVGVASSTSCRDADDLILMAERAMGAAREQRR